KQRKIFRCVGCQQISAIGRMNYVASQLSTVAGSRLVKPICFNCLGYGLRVHTMISCKEVRNEILAAVAKQRSRTSKRTAIIDEYNSSHRILHIRGVA